MYWHPQATARAVADAGLRATVGAPLLDPTAAPSGCGDSALQQPRLPGGAGPGGSRRRSPRTRSTPSARSSLRWIAELGAERGVPVQIHLSETAQEVEDCIAAHGVRPAAYLDRLGMLSERTVLAHGVWLDREELELIAERGATVVTNPVANMKLAVGGVFPYPAARAAGVAVGLGTDGAGSNDSLDLLADLKALRPRPEARRRRPDRDRRRRGLGGRHRRPGAAARRRRAARGRRRRRLPAAARPAPPSSAIGDLASDLVYAASGSVVDTTVVGGRVLMRGGVVPEPRRSSPAPPSAPAASASELDTVTQMARRPRQDRRGLRTVLPDGLRGLVGAGARLRDLRRSSRPGCRASGSRRPSPATASGRWRRRPGSAPPPPPAPTRRSRSPSRSSRRAPRRPPRSPSSSPRPTWSGSWAWSSGC